ncbi:MAG TPA: hypothetical protein ENJ42_03355 [Hellea balneolensis]|uniref:DUF302 domain-containing protein n=1 Tax=Hellea balneolensis TaxID=287478 RepID=A0A7C5LZI2_9PROT|nr:hypothetical protein [Hellea balneolensis]
MKKLWVLIAAISGVYSPAYADDNIADCEVVIARPVEPVEDDTKQRSTDAMIATFVPAGAFVFSVFDTKPGHLEQIDGHKIRALMCVRASVIPTEFDLKLIQTGIPFYISPDFDTPNSPMLGVEKKDGKFEVIYSGEKLSKEDQALLDLRMEVLNAQG